MVRCREVVRSVYSRPCSVCDRLLFNSLSQVLVMSLSFFCFFFFKQKTAYEIGLGIPAEPLFRSEDKLCLIFKLAPSVCRMTFPILASLLVRLVVLLPFQLLRLSLATPSRWTPLALSVFLHCVVALLLTLL